MRARPVRPNIYLPVVRFGVADSDWFSVLLISCAGYLAPVPFGITILYVPLQMWTWLLATAGSIAFFNYIRIGKRPYWLPHKLKSLFLDHRQYRALPNGRKRGFQRAWLIDAEADNKALNFQRSLSKPNTAQTALLLEHHNRLQEVCEKKWNEPLLTTN
jgi:hypothetical protein